MGIRENWRIVALVVLLVLSGISLFAPTGTAGGTDNVTQVDANETQLSADGGITNLQYGLELSGGTRLRTQLVGLTAENAGVANQDTDVRAIRQTVSGELGVDAIDVNVRPESNTVEVFDANVTKEEFAAALGEAGLDVSTDQIRDGVTSATFETAENVLDKRINKGGLTGGDASTVQAATGEDFLVIEVPGATRSEVKELIGEPGRVEIVAGYPVQTENGTEYRNETVVRQDGITRITPVRSPDGGRPYVGITLTDSTAETYRQVLIDKGFTNEGVGRCRWQQEPENPGYCLYTVVDGERRSAATMTQDLATTLKDEDAFINNPSFRITTNNLSDAQEIKLNLESGALPTELDIQSEMYLAPSLAQEFKPLALVTGLVAWLVVSGVIFYRYREARVAVPMLLTAGAEVFILLGFASAVGLALNLSHIAGLIAVIGTGVDDLVIIADEILQRGTVATGRVFESRFRKAFWVIGAAAATTIIAMSPLAVLSLGELQGFAIVTIVGVLIGVLVTRPAYGDVLRNLLLEEEE
ncbi:preprotein translocase subunit SecD [Salinibaculum rarum]|uniref:preprotein translocase subunit SecD n=1 Tax=Salinibaculum rarum TaxID=3058903 RepID=UPI00265F0401|nr:preprotein translocase subunit SecD [Salinibaculum sp. KK48]